MQVPPLLRMPVMMSQAMYNFCFVMVWWYFHHLPAHLPFLDGILILSWLSWFNRIFELLCHQFTHVAWLFSILWKGHSFPVIFFCKPLLSSWYQPWFFSSIARSSRPKICALSKFAGKHEGISSWVSGVMQKFTVAYCNYFIVSFGIVAKTMWVHKVYFLNISLWSISFLF